MWDYYDSDHYVEEEERDIPGVDHKAKLGLRSLKHEKQLNLTSVEGQNKFLGSVKKELSKKSNVHKLQTAFQGRDDGTQLASKTVWSCNQQIAMQLTNPLDGISLPHYITKNENKTLVKDIPRKALSGDEDDGDHDPDTAAKLLARPSVVAVNMKWKPGITLKQGHRYTTKKTQLEPLMKKTEFDYETKTKFESRVESVCDEIFPEWRRELMILDGNDSHHSQSLAVATCSTSSGKSSNFSANKVARSERLTHEGTGPARIDSDPYAREWKEYSDLEEHKIFVIPYHSKNGFNTDISTRYQFPYQAKFVIGRRTFHHKFMLQLPLSKSPQHYGLIFTFSEDPLGHSKLRIKSLLTVYSIFPSTPKFACLETYEMNSEVEQLEFEESQSTKKKYPGAAGKAAKNAVRLLSDNLKEEKIVQGTFGNMGTITRELPQAGEDCYRHRRLYRNDYNPDTVKQKKKKQIMKNIRMEQAKC